MSYKTILVTLDQGETAAEMTRVGLAVAGRFGAHLVGLVQAESIFQYGTMMSAEIPPSLLDAWTEQRDGAMAKIRAAVEADAARGALELRLNGDDWTPMSMQAALHARYADLTIVPLADSDGSSDERRAVPERIVMESGRPMLLLPRSGCSENFGKHVLIAWNASREANRAVHDAMPFLAAADKVSLISINPGDGPIDGHGADPGVDIATVLARHGLSVEAEVDVNPDVSPAERLLSRAFEIGADMLVMGAYGHSRMREMILGGVTRDMLEDATLPVLMSH